MSPEMLSSILSLVVLAVVTPLFVCRNDDGDLISATIFAIPIAIFGAIAVVRLLAINGMF